MGIVLPYDPYKDRQWQVGVQPMGDSIHHTMPGYWYDGQMQMWIKDPTKSGEWQWDPPTQYFPQTPPLRFAGNNGSNSNRKVSNMIDKQLINADEVKKRLGRRR